MTFAFCGTLDLPADFSSEDILQYLRRDRLELAERVQDGMLQKDID